MQHQQQLEQTWAEIQARLRRTLPTSVYKIWLAPLRPLTLERSALYLEAPRHSRGWVHRRFGSALTVAAASVNPSIERVELLPPGERLPHSTTAAGAAQPSHATPFKPSYTFDHFVIGPSNRFAHAAALAVAEMPGQAYSPLLLYGPAGIGKTHLLQAIGNYVSVHDGSLSVHYATLERFTNDFAAALRHNRIDRFKQAHRQADVLLLDDVQFLEGKEKTAEELFHTCDAIADAGGQLVLSSDRPPVEMPLLQACLRERLQAGLVADLHPPDFGVRLAILQKRAEATPQLHRSTGVLEHIAARVTANVRALEGALVRVVAFASLTEQPLSPAVAEQVLHRLYPQAGSAELPDASGLTPLAVQHAVAAEFGVSMHDLQSRQRGRLLLYARQAAMYLSRELTTYSLSAIGESFGGRDHTTVLHAHRRVAALASHDKPLQARLAAVTERLLLQPHTPAVVDYTTS